MTTNAASTDLAALVANLPFAVVDECEAQVLVKLATRAQAGDGTCADLLVGRLWEDAVVHEIAGNCIKANVVRAAIEKIEIACF